jgi:hypothetical protein
VEWKIGGGFRISVGGGEEWIMRPGAGVMEEGRDGVGGRCRLLSQILAVLFEFCLVALISRSHLFLLSTTAVLIPRRLAHET